MKTKIIPFDAEMAKDIQDGEIEGRIMCNNAEANVIDLDMDFQGKKRICAQTLCNDGKYHTNIYNAVGIDVDSNSGYRLYIELQYPDNEPQFKPFDKVLVRDCEEDEWQCNLFSHLNVTGSFRTTGGDWMYCIPYEGNEHLVGTINKPK